MSPTVFRVLMGAGVMLAIALSSVTIWHQAIAQGQEAKRYVYKVVDVPADNTSMQTILNEYGAAGWELIVIGMGDMTVPRLVFKK